MGHSKDGKADYAGAKVLVVVCIKCKKIRDADGCWMRAVSHIMEGPGVLVSHGMCQVCARKLYPDFYPLADA